MKKLLILTLCLLLVFTLGACGNDNTPDKGDAEPGIGNLFSFTTETFGGETFTQDDLKDAKLVLVNLWEPWCGPCVGEMPDLEKVYEEFKDEGFVILGVFSETTQDEDVAALIEKDGITYPIIRKSEEFAVFDTGYVPTSVFLTGEGEILSSEPIIGSQSYDTWKTAVKSLLEGLDD